MEAARNFFSIVGCIFIFKFSLSEIEFRSYLLIWQKWHSPYIVVLVVLRLPVVFFLYCVQRYLFFLIFRYFFVLLHPNSKLTAISYIK